jgi:hypothetical protein
LAGLGALGPSNASEKVALPQSALAVVAETLHAAEARDYDRLRSLMTTAFTWSFGGDGDADQALDAWRTNPDEYLRNLVDVLRLGCNIDSRFHDGARVICPGRGDLDYRAGFLETQQGWKFEYFVAGD